MLNHEATCEDYHCQYWQHKTSGDIYAVQVIHDPARMMSCGPLHHSEVRDVLDHDYDDEFDDDPDEWRVLTAEDVQRIAEQSPA